MCSEHKGNTANELRAEYYLSGSLVTKHLPNLTTGVESEFILTGVVSPMGVILDSSIVFYNWVSYVYVRTVLTRTK